MTMLSSEQAEALKTIQGEAAIRDLVHRYALNIRNGDGRACAELMTPDIEFTVRAMDPQRRDDIVVRSHTIGRDQVLDHIQRPLAELALCPMIHNLLIDIDGDRAHASSIMENRTFPPIPGMIGEYQDDFRYEGRWLFSRRIYTLFVQRSPEATQ